MSLMPGQEGLRLDQAPPLAVPLTFFLTVPVAIAAAGATLLVQGGAALATAWGPATIALTHLGTLGVLGMAMCGALYQMIPVVAGAPVPAVRLGFAVYALLASGTAALSAGLLLGGPPWLFTAALLLLGAALALFLGPVTWAIWRAPTRSPTVAGMRLALASLAAVAVLGIVMAQQYAAVEFTAQRPFLLQTHLTLGLLGWVGGLVTAVSWQVLPMFYLAQPLAEPRANAVLWSLGAGLALTLAGLFVAPAFAPSIAPTAFLALCALPAAVAIWGLAPLLAFRALRLRRRPRADASLRAWQAAIGLAPCVALTAALAAWGEDGRWNLAFGWLAIWGWAGLTLHGMLTRIVPFLIWFHRFSRLVGLVPVPPMNRLYPEAAARLGLGLHVATLITGLAAIASGWDWLARVVGLLLLLTGLALGRGLWRAVQHRAAAAPPAAT